MPLSSRKIVFLVVGGDSRQTYLAARLARENALVYTYGLDGTNKAEGCAALDAPEELPEKADVLVLPIVSSNDGVHVTAPFLSDDGIPVSALLPCLKPGALVAGGRIMPETDAFFTARGFAVSDYFTREELIIKNCIPTAEGALQIAMEELPITMSGAKVLITGFGRVAKATAKIFKSVDASVSICARKYADLAWAQLYGYAPVHISKLSDEISGYDLVINTIPAIVLNHEILAKLSPEALVIDLASKPGGVDFETARQLRLKAIWALSLPGKVAPVTSGIIIADTVVNILRERGEQL
ncbi:MAG: dipicolinate synthase subunit DpsA [Oscillospiraceae bacterium]